MIEFEVQCLPLIQGDQSVQQMEEAVVDLEADISRTMRQVRRTMADLLDSLPISVRNAAELRTALRLDQKLAWQIFTIINTPNSSDADLLTASRYVPGSPSLTRFLAAASASGVATPKIDAVRNAAQEFSEMVKIHAGDRTEFDSLISAMSSRETTAREAVSYRRGAYRNESHIWGLQIGVLAHLLIIKPSDVSKGIDACAIQTRLAFRRLRPDATLRVLSYAVEGNNGRLVSANHEAIDPDAALTHGAPILPQFCSSPLPKFKTIETASKWKYVIAEGSSVGRRNAIDLTFGHAIRHSPGSPTTPLDEQNTVASTLAMSIPLELLVSTMMIHRPTLGRPKMKLEIFRDNMGDTAGTDASWALPAYDKIEFVGSGVDGAYSPDVPRYPDLVRVACSRMGWNPEEFDVYRLRIPYPVLNSMVRMIAQFDEEAIKAIRMTGNARTS